MPESQQLKLATKGAGKWKETAVCLSCCTVVPLSNGIYGCQNACTESLTSTHSISGCKNKRLPSWIAFPDLKMRVHNVTKPFRMSKRLYSSAFRRTPLWELVSSRSCPVPSYKCFLDNLDLPSIKKFPNQPPKQKTVYLKPLNFLIYLWQAALSSTLETVRSLHQRLNTITQTTSDTETTGNVTWISPAT